MLQYVCLFFMSFLCLPVCLFFWLYFIYLLICRSNLLVLPFVHLSICPFGPFVCRFVLIFLSIFQFFSIHGLSFVRSFLCPFAHLSLIYFFLFLSICLVPLPICLSLRLPIWSLSICLPACQPICHSFILPSCQPAILPACIPTQSARRSAPLPACLCPHASACMPLPAHLCLHASAWMPLPVSPSACLPLPDTDQILQIIYLMINE